jgi:hypothetical protein
MLRTGKHRFRLHYVKKGQILNYVTFITLILQYYKGHEIW